MAQRRTGSINFTELMKAAKAAHSAFSRAENGNVYVNVVMWHNDEKDARGNDTSMLLQSSKDKREAEGKIYVGNFRSWDDTPKSDNAGSNASNFVADGDDLPF